MERSLSLSDAMRSGPASLKRCDDSLCATMGVASLNPSLPAQMSLPWEPDFHLLKVSAMQAYKPLMIVALRHLVLLLKLTGPEGLSA